jgi:7,8-dihydropterin-6-yl-methyl-4-(beta-D-ribofuranosyl)aminobenzene 5'-phosphate synthase
MSAIALQPADRVELTILADNYSDLLLADTPVARRLRVPPPNAPLAEHGLACLVSVYADQGRHTVLMDAGISGTCLKHNARMLSISLAVQKGEISHSLGQVESVVLSHGHFDHFAGMPDYLEMTGKPMPLVLHPGAFVERRLKMGPDLCLDLPALKPGDLEKAGAVLDERQAASTVAGGFILVTGEVERVTDFEKGAANLEAKIEDQWVKDPFTDDQAIAIWLKNKGLVVIGGCSHAGIINTVKHVCRTAGIDRVYAVLGGFHLSGAGEALIAPTVQEMKKIGPEIIVPMHCTGWKAINAFAAEMPQQFVLNSVGTTYIFDA